MTAEQNRLRRALADVLARPDLTGGLELMRARLAALAAEPTLEQATALLSLEREWAITGEVRRGFTFGMAAERACKVWPMLFRFGGDSSESLTSYYRRLLKQGQASSGTNIRRALERVAVGGAA